MQWSAKLKCHIIFLSWFYSRTLNGRENYCCIHLLLFKKIYQVWHLINEKHFSNQQHRFRHTSSTADVLTIMKHICHTLDKIRMVVLLTRYYKNSSSITGWLFNTIGSFLAKKVSGCPLSSVIIDLNMALIYSGWFFDYYP